ncbi:MAG TPA: hypothetical protein VIA11_14925 [Acidimicrobiia bacterium]|jgi:hypothetical protein|nr:hypothetical protein [Acidimicrobiia bacterium]
MLRRRREQPSGATAIAPAFEDFHAWVLSLPWVVERPYSVETPGIRCFGVDCEPLARRQVWLLTGLERQLDAHGLGLAVIVPADAAGDIEGAGLGRIVSPMPRGNALMAVSCDSLAGRAELETVVLSAYCCALS